jgi:hypothetical protein
MADSKKPNQQSFEQLASEASPGFVAELRDFLKQNKKWWLTPIIMVVVLLGVMIFLASTGAAPFIYTLF